MRFQYICRTVSFIVFLFHLSVVHETTPTIVWSVILTCSIHTEISWTPNIFKNMLFSTRYWVIVNHIQASSSGPSSSETGLDILGQAGPQINVVPQRVINGVCAMKKTILPLFFPITFKRITVGSPNVVTFLNKV